jgi:uncharacterized damage-inducible protein DinB
MRGMTWLEQYRALARYNNWMNAKIYASAGQLTPEQRTRDMGAFFGSVHGTLNHLLLTDCVWFARDASFLPRAQDGSRIQLERLDQEVYADFAERHAQRQQLDARICDWVGELTETELLGELAYTTSSGEPQRHPLWQALSHCFNHQTHHRGQITALLTQLGADPGVTDLVAMLREPL